MSRTLRSSISDKPRKKYKRSRLTPQLIDPDFESQNLWAA